MAAFSADHPKAIAFEDANDLLAFEAGKSGHLEICLHQPFKRVARVIFAFQG